MKVIVPEDIPELRYMPMLVGGLIGLGLLAALTGKRPPALPWVGLFAAGAVAGLADFYRWGYDYGHDLDPAGHHQDPGHDLPATTDRQQAAAQFPRDLLARLGRLGPIAAALLTGIWLALREYRRCTATPGLTPVRLDCGLHWLLVLALTGALSGMRAHAAPGHRLGPRTCRHCHMTLADPRFAAESLTRTGKAIVFDDVGCLATWLAGEPCRRCLVLGREFRGA